MKKGDLLYHQYVNILKEELRPAMGCTEPVALAYAAAKARQVLGAIPDQVEARISGDGIVTKGADKTVRNIGILAREGMKETDKTILEIMLRED